jgi:hypothetical protein
MCFRLFKLSPNAFKFIVNFNTLHKKGHMCLSFKVHIYWIMHWMLLIMILNVINDYNISNFVIMVKNKVVHLIIM